MWQDQGFESGKGSISPAPRSGAGRAHVSGESGSADVWLLWKYGRCTQGVREIREKNVLSWNIYLAAHAQNGHPQEARRIFDWMARNTVSWNAMVAAYAQEGHTDQANVALKKMPAWEAATWNAVISGHVKNMDMDCAKRVVQRLPEASTISFGNDHLGICSERESAECEGHVRQMQQRGFLAWNLIITAYARRRHLKDARSVFDKMPELTVVSWTILVSAYAENGYLQEAQSVFRSMPEKNFVAWNTVFAHMPRVVGYLREAKMTFDAMPNKHPLVQGSIED